MIDMLPATAHSSPENVKALKDSIVAHCANDAWSGDVLTCVDAAKSNDDIAKCDQLLTPEQHAALAKDSDEEAAPTPAPDTKKKAGPKKGGDPEEGGE